MVYSTVALYSPLSIKNAKENRDLLLQFILSELFHILEIEQEEESVEFVLSSFPNFFPYDCSYAVGCLNKMHEHTQLLGEAFPHLMEATQSFEATFESVVKQIGAYKKNKEPVSAESFLPQVVNLCKTLYLSLEPFLMECKKSENLLLFLLKHSSSMQKLSSCETVQSLFSKMFPENREYAVQIIQQKYKQRGFKGIVKTLDKIAISYA